jgi:hypothetical protein
MGNDPLKSACISFRNSVIKLQAEASLVHAENAQKENAHASSKGVLDMAALLKYGAQSDEG